MRAAVGALGQFCPTLALELAKRVGAGGRPVNGERAGGSQFYLECGVIGEAGVLLLFTVERDDEFFAIEFVLYCSFAAIAGETPELIAALMRSIRSASEVFCNSLANGFCGSDGERVGAILVCTLSESG